ncbi:hypothetical protein A4A49_33667 [Nicotiana attenuata]|uniref:Uncharacterized protein n=1 Tax=Nicotiana attenuata TaxID=49451 RepID=A0A1J6HY74_NICAT|nr:hypothetical protein A4A49_33667 [Nicotiana attenuata]
MSRAAFPPKGDPVEKLFSTNYMSWWEKVLGKFLEDNLQALVENVRLKSTIPLGDEDQGVGKTLSIFKELRTPIPKVVTQHKKSKLKSSKSALKEVVCISTDMEKHPPVLPFSTQVPQDTSQSNNEDQNWKRKRPNPVEIVEVPSVDSPSRTHTTCNKELNAIRNPMVSPHDKPQEFILGLWEDICNRLSETRGEQLSSYREKITEIFKDMKKANILDFSPLECLLDSLSELATSYDQERSNLADKTSQDEKLKLISKAKERLKSFNLEASEKVKKVSSSEKKLKRVVKKLQTLQQERENLEGIIETTQKEVEEIQAKVSAAETEVSSYDNVNFLTVDDSANLEEKKKNLETSCQELINYKFYLD